MSYSTASSPLTLDTANRYTIENDFGDVGRWDCWNNRVPVMYVDLEQKFRFTRGFRCHFVRCSPGHVTRYICQYCSVHTSALHVT